MPTPRIKLVVILGPTASGKSSLAIRLAKRFHGEIVSADSRQIFRGLAVGSGMVTKKEMHGVLHHLLAFRNPTLPYSAEQYKKLAVKTIKAIARRGNIPFLVGGTGFYIDAVARNLRFPAAKPNPALRKKLSALPVEKLLVMLQKLDPRRAATIDGHNPRRLMRAIEIATTGTATQLVAGPKIFYPLYIGVATDRQKLKQKIAKRFTQWLKQGFLSEVRVLMRTKLPEARFKELGLHYWHAYRFLHGDETESEFKEKSVSSIGAYAKRQMTWFQRNKSISWVHSYNHAQQLTVLFLGNGKRDEQGND